MAKAQIRAAAAAFSKRHYAACGNARTYLWSLHTTPYSTWLQRIMPIALVSNMLTEALSRGEKRGIKVLSLLMGARQNVFSLFAEATLRQSTPSPLPARRH